MSAITVNLFRSDPGRSFVLHNRAESSAILIALILACGSGLFTGFKNNKAHAAEIRVGIVAFQDFHEAGEQYMDLFEQLSAADPDFRFRLALGTYGDVAHWVEQRMIDVAIVTPGLYRHLVRSHPDESLGYRYLVTEELPAAKSTWAKSDRRRETYQSFYRSVCIVPVASGVQSSADLKRYLMAPTTELLFVHPFSMSGFLVPRVALDAAGIPTEKIRRADFTHSHTASLRAVARSETPIAAFVWDDALRYEPQLDGKVRAIDWEELSARVIPADAVLVRDGLESADRLKSLLVAYESPNQERRFRDHAQWVTTAAELPTIFEPSATENSSTHSTLLTEQDPLLVKDSLKSVSLDEIGDLLLHYARTQQSPPRLALVLPGGGAKCSYQVGAIQALEEKVAELQSEEPLIDIHLVVGTSGGAINSLPVALGITRTTEGRAAFRSTWLSLDQRDIVTPSLVLRVNIGLWFAIAEAALLLMLIRAIFQDEATQGWMFLGATLLLGLMQLVLTFLRPPFAWMGMNHVAHHIWLWVSLGLPTAAIGQIVLAVFLAVLQIRRRRQGTTLRIPLGATRWSFAIGLIALPLIQLTTILFVENTLSRGDGMEHALAVHFPRLVEYQLSRRGQKSLELPTSLSDAERLQATSHAIFERKLLQRDLVVTGSCIEQSPHILPTDLYFFARGRLASADNQLGNAREGSRTPSVSMAIEAPYGARGVNVEDHPEILLDVIAGSGSIFPMFPPREVSNFPQPGMRVALVDGGFAHNSPVEAAVLWGATHIVVVESKPAARVQRGNFLQNAAASFVHLHHQAQLQDTRSRGRVALFSLEPTPPHLCVLDFSRNLLEASIAQGYADARGIAPVNVRAFTKDEAPKERRSFRKEFGEPVFIRTEEAR